MIRISCTNCKTVLSIDDAFAGGVCRCQHCGTIQTVPARAKEKMAAGVAGAALDESKAIYRGNNTSKPEGSGLDELAEIVASSGLGGSGLASRRLTRTVPPPAKKIMLPLVIAVCTILVLVVIIIWLMMRSGPSKTDTTLAPAPTPAPLAAGSEPAFCGIPLNVPTVVYVLDRGSGTQQYFAGLKDATLQSIASLGSERHFQIIFWNNGSDTAYPENSTAYATKDNIASAKRVVEDISASGASDATAAMKNAFARNPSVIVIATAKGWDLDDAWAQKILQLRGSSTAKIDAINLGSDGASAGLKTLATQTGGEYRDVTGADLRSFAGH